MSVVTLSERFARGRYQSRTAPRLLSAERQVPLQKKKEFCWNNCLNGLRHLGGGVLCVTPHPLEASRELNYIVPLFAPEETTIRQFHDSQGEPLTGRSGRKG